MNQISWRHHYIPQFYLKGFTSGNGSFKIFDIQKNRFIKEGKDFYPESFFFEKDANSIYTEKGRSDFIEEAFKIMDTKTAEVFNRLNNSSSNENFNVNDNDIALLEYFIGILYWRIPSKFEELKELIERKKLKEIGLKINNQGKKTEDSIGEQRLRNDSNFVKSMKFLFPSISYPEVFDSNIPYIMSLPEGLPSICSDNPIICLNPATFKVYSDDLILPLSSNKLFIRGGKLNDFMSTVKIEIDLLTFKQAIKYVSCTDERYIYMLEDLYQKSYRDLNNLRYSIFKQILNNTS